MSDLLGHVGAWAPRAEQIATAEFLDDAESFAGFRREMHRRLRERLELVYRNFMRMKERGLPVEAIEPEGTLYLSVHLDLFGRTLDGRTIQSNDDIRRLLLQKAGIGVVPFQAFGLDREDGWFRISVGGASLRAIEDGMARLQALLSPGAN
jgi:aspartate aminotransferase